MNQATRAKLIARVNARRMHAGKEPLRIVHIARALRFLFGPTTKPNLGRYFRKGGWWLTELGESTVEAYRAGTLKLEAERDSR